jgi:membrane-bound metal-dependent hydrolase YbcI (DUF457 family)
MGSTHRALGFVAGAAYGQVTGLTWPLVLAAGGVAMVTSAGRLSPDVDQYGWWQTADRMLPDEALGRGGPMQHRGITHWWGWPALVTAAWVLGFSGMPESGGWLWLALGAAGAGWWSHLVGDLVFGQAGGFPPRGPGIPLMPWWAHVGVGVDCGGLLERVVGLALVPAGVWVVAATAGLTP